MKTLLGNMRPRFWGMDGRGEGPRKYTVNFRRIWKLTVVSTLAAALLPLLIMFFIDYHLSREATLAEVMFRSGRLVSNTRRSVSYYLLERKSAIDFINLSESYEALLEPGRLERILASLKESFGGFVDIGVIDESGVQRAYSGPYNLLGKGYHEAEWFRDVSANSVYINEADWFKEPSAASAYISEVFRGLRDIPHMVIAVKHALADGRFYILRATLDTQRLADILSGIEVGGEGDAFLINRAGVLQTPSQRYGGVLEPVGGDLPVPRYSEHSQVRLLEGAVEGPLVLGYAYIPDSPFILMVVKPQSRLMFSWNLSRLKLVALLAFSSFLILLVVLGGTTFLVNQIYLADQRRLMAVHKIEYANKMASLGRLSAGVAHEINNPLAIINEKAGLIKDLFTYTDAYAKDTRLTGLIDSVLASVDRCARITHRLLNFARRSDTANQEVDLARIVGEVLGFMGKQAEYRDIEVSLKVEPDVPPIISDPGRLQEIFLNLLTNAFAAVDDGGLIEIRARLRDAGRVEIRFSDNGHGIPEADLERVFEPFFSTKTGQGGTGLGLSVTYGLVEELGGRIEVASVVGQGTTFTLVFPLRQKIGAQPPKEREEA